MSGPSFGVVAGARRSYLVSALDREVINSAALFSVARLVCPGKKQFSDGPWGAVTYQPELNLLSCLGYIECAHQGIEKGEIETHVLVLVLFEIAVVNLVHCRAAYEGVQGAK